MVTSALAAAAMTRPRRRILSRMPMFILPVLLYVVVALSVTNVRATFFSIGPYALSWVEVLYLLGFFVSTITDFVVSIGAHSGFFCRINATTGTCNALAKCIIDVSTEIIKSH